MLNPLLCVNWGLMEEVKTCFPQSTRQSRVFFVFLLQRDSWFFHITQQGAKEFTFLATKIQKSSLHTTIRKISGQKSKNTWIKFLECTYLDVNSPPLSFFPSVYCMFSIHMSTTRSFLLKPEKWQNSKLLPQA